MLITLRQNKHTKFQYHPIQIQKKKRMNKYVVNSNYKFLIPVKQNDLDPQLSDEEWIRLYKQLFGNKTLSIYFGEYGAYHIPTVLKNLILSNVEEIEMQYTGHARIMKFLAFPFFKDLKKLNLGNNYISSVEFFSIIPAPNLESISLNDNKIQNLKPFHKNRFDRLKSIDLRNNQIHELKGIQSLFINELVLESLDYDKTMSYSLLNVFKLPCQELKILSCFFIYPQECKVLIGFKFQQLGDSQKIDGLRYGFTKRSKSFIEFHTQNEQQTTYQH